MVYMPAMDERQRYQRHLQLQGFGEAGQQALGASHICIVGLGGLGCPASLYLAAAGVGRLTLVDGDTVSLSNLQRQVLFREADIDRNKAAAAAEQLAQRNSGIAIHAVDSFLDIALAEQLFSDVDLVLDCTDNFHTRYLINDICHALAKPWVYASVLGFSGQLALFTPGEACFRCLFPELSEAPDCNQAGVIGAVPGVMGTLQALEAIKFLGPENTPTDNSLVSVDGAGLKLRQFKLSPDPGCVLCSGRQTYRDRTADYQPPGIDTSIEEVAAAAFRQFLEEHHPLLIDVRSYEEHIAGNLGGDHIPLAELAEAADDLLESGKPVLVYCQSGIRSRSAVAMLRQHGLTKAMSLAGGYTGQSTAD
ncbi:thiazole biosynthesis adenylyltransferase ThiF [Halioglobus japonicus]|uniref:Rhodanese domain-containing protein n=1 Tax=Halioglobus japonicus TaxID=930805 RepID=A0AAP8MDB0_9GAMM|nr:ThiF family adenylyltransferase [Halioglobus japonicus]PLW85685.1 hypothetical protein C0029_13825 [Halioglobus japonicus]GHD16943.1 thiazole biosynthesis adenylyltransferase ThiF [Halioglobus japonicus]